MSSNNVKGWVCAGVLFGAVYLAEFTGEALASTTDPCDFENGGSVAECQGLLEEQEDYACDEWGTDCDDGPTSWSEEYEEPVTLYDPVVTEGTVTYQVPGDSGFDTVTVPAQ